MPFPKVMQLLENVRIKQSNDRTLATGMAMGKLISKKAGSLSVLTLW